MPRLTLARALRLTATALLLGVLLQVTLTTMAPAAFWACVAQAVAAGLLYAAANESSQP